MINVSKPCLPPFEEYTKYLKLIWESGKLTNNGPLLCMLEEQLQDYLGINHVVFVSSGTMALQIAIRCCDLKGEVITTPFSHASGVNALKWENCKPVFADIEEGSFLIDPAKIEAAITEHTTGILATHVYGLPCKIKEIESIAVRYNLKVIYDGAHAFGVKILNHSIFNYGNVSAVSFHSTKLFHTIEGGAIITNDEKLAEKCIMFRNFGLKDDEYQLAGINGKNSEFHAAMGLCNLPKVPEVIRKRMDLSNLYRTLLKNLPLSFPNLPVDVEYNYPYFPVTFRSEAAMNSVIKALSDQGIFARRYFYPSLNNLDYCKGASCPVSEDIASRVLCLPLYNELSFEDVRTISRLVSEKIYSGPVTLRLT